MNTKQIIKQIGDLQAIEPSSADMHAVHKKILLQTQEQPETGKNIFYYAVFFALVLLVFTFAALTQPIFLQTEFYQTKMVLSQNSYQKAKFSLLIYQKELAFLKKQPNDVKRISAATNALATTHTYLAQLNLNGENGQ